MSFRIIVIIGLLLLQSCGNYEELPPLQAQGYQKKQTAASYNIQLGLAYLNRGERSRAKQKFIKALDLEPNFPEAYLAMAYFFEKTGDIKEAEKFYQKALNLQPKNGATLNNYGAFLCRRGQHRRAEYFFLKAVRDMHYVNTAMTYQNAGMCAASVADYSKAAKYYLRSVQQDPEQKQALYELLRLTMKQNKSLKANEYLEKYKTQLRKDPELKNIAIKTARHFGLKDHEHYYKSGANNEHQHQ
jgi:type IV pilus assembly protein PilF